jgi:5-(carboxyamino)imidazole ribonucleotide mutase
MAEPASVPLVGLIMGSQSDWETMRAAAELLGLLSIPFETRVVSAHRTPKLLFDYASASAGRGLRLIIAAAGGSAHLPGMVAALTELPVIGVPIESKTLRGVDSLLSIVQMPAGVPVATMSIGASGAINSAIMAASILAPSSPAIASALRRYRTEQTEKVMMLPPLTA